LTYKYSKTSQQTATYLAITTFFTIALSNTKKSRSFQAFTWKQWRWYLLDYTHQMYYTYKMTT